MPDLDKTGPRGEGPMTGRKMGLCNSSNKKAEESEHVIFKRRGQGLARGIRGRFLNRNN